MMSGKTRSYFLKTALLMIVLADLSNFSFAQDGKKIKTQKIAAGKIERYFARRENDAKFSGAVLAARNGSLIFKKGFGMANFEFSIPNSPRTRFRIGSVTKPLTAIAVMMLQEKGRLNVEDGICKYLSASSCPDEWRDVKIRHLLTHTSGIPDLFGAMDAVPVEKTAEEIDRVIAGIKNRQLKARPGEVYAYSNFGYCLLGYIIEKASGKLYAELLDDYIFKPLQMNGTLYDDPRPLIKDRAEGYIRRSGQIYNDKLTDPAGYSAGGLLSSVEDLLVLNDALNSGRLLSRESLDRMFTPFKNEYGFGWKITADKNGRVFNHTGETHGFSSHIAYYPKEKIFIVVLSNIENEDARNTASDIAGIIFDQNP